MKPDPPKGYPMIDNAPLYNLKAVIHETGLGPETLRAWERRYGLLKPQRSPGGHRLYSQDDIEMLKWLVARQKEGLSISHAVEMWRRLEKDGQNPRQQTQSATQVLNVSGSTLDDLRHGWITACLAFDEQSAERSLSQAFAIADPEIACTEVLQKGLAEIGYRWYQGVISVQQEHFASALAMRRINTISSATPPPTRPERFLAACPPGEEHEFILLLAAFLLRRRGWDVVYLGANVPLSQLDETLRLNLPSLILSVAQTLNSAATLREMAEYVNTQGVPLVYGGGIFTMSPAITERIPGYYLGNEVAAIPQIVEHLLSMMPPLPNPLPISPEYKQTMATFVENEARIIAYVTQAMRPDQLEPAHLENANSYFSRDLISALSLGDIHFLDHSVGWLLGLLENHGLSPSLAGRYFTAYRQAVQRYLGNHGSPILDWFTKVSQSAQVK
jgi:DNA-binding transcriptional MerR regulator